MILGGIPIPLWMIAHELVILCGITIPLLMITHELVIPGRSHMNW
jgi:hypothetical protein